MPMKVNPNYSAIARPLYNIPWLVHMAVSCLNEPNVNVSYFVSEKEPGA
jgi:hypothetical protein